MCSLFVSFVLVYYYLFNLGVCHILKSVCGGQRITLGISFLLLPCGLLVLIPGYQACRLLRHAQSHLIKLCSFLSSLSEWLYGLMILSFALLTNQPLLLILIFHGYFSIYKIHFHLTVVSSVHHCSWWQRSGVCLLLIYRHHKENRYIHKFKLVNKTRQKYKETISYNELPFPVEISAPVSASILSTFYYN